MEDKIRLSFCLCVLSTSVFLLALCHFHIEEEENKKKVFHYSPTISPKPLPSIVSSTIASAPFVCPPQACGAPLTIPAKSYSRGCCQQATEDHVQATPRVRRWLSLWETPGTSSSLVATRMCFGVCVPPLTSRTV